MFDAAERAALDSVAPFKRLVCGHCRKVMPFTRGILNGIVVYSCDGLCGSLSASGVRVKSPKDVERETGGPGP